MRTSTPDRWQRKDAWLGVLFVAFGVLVTLYAFLAMRNEAPMFPWGSGWIVGPLLLFLGGNAIVRSVRAGRRAGE
jgi:hypothetical protein